MSHEENKNLLNGFGSSNESSNRVLPNAGNSKSSKRRNIFIGAGVGVVLLVVLIIILTSGGSDPEPTPTPPGPSPVPPIPGGYNPYRVDQASVQDEEFQVSALLQYAPSSEAASSRVRAPVASKKPSIINPQDIPLGANNQAIQSARLLVGQVDYTVARLIITDEQTARFSPPEDVVRAAPFLSQLRLDMCGFELNLEPFSFSFSDQRQPDSPTLLTTKDQSFAFYDKYMQLDMKLFSQRIYGLGERNREFTLGEGTWTMWAHGRETPYDDGQGGKQTYGVHPFALVQTATPGEYMGLYFRNSNAQSPVLQHNKDGTSVLSYITVGGQIDVFFFFKGSAKQIINQYQGLVGRPNLPPFWAYGWHAASYGYKNQSDVQANVDGYAQADMPLEGIWIDIPEMDNYQDFTINKTAFPSLPAFTEALHAAGQKLVVIVDAGLSADDLSNTYFALANEKNLLLKSAISDEMGGILTAKVWPNKTVFLDWFNPESADLWSQGLADFYKEAPYDGLWLDMNEVTTFCDGECPSGGHESNSSSQNATNWFLSFAQDQNSTYFLPFIPGQHNLDFMTVSLNGTHPSTNYSQFDTHSLFGLMEAAATRNFLIGDERSPHKGNRSFTLSRSTFAGSGVHTTHWLGDNHREWAYLNYSISGMMNFNMFGIPFVGPDTCGFFKARNAQDLQDEQQLCGRWMQLATFQPFGRIHRDMDDADGGRGGNRTEPYLLDEPYKTWARNALYDRLQFLRQLYTCHYAASRDGDTCFDPLLFHFPLDDGAFEQTEHSFIYANALKVSPVLHANATSISSYFPAGHWVSLSNFSDVVAVDCPKNQSDCFGVYGEWRNLSVSNESDSQIHSHLMPGAMLAFQNNSQKFKLTSQIMAQDVTLIANRDHNGQASGKLFLDDGISLEQLYESNSYEYYQFLLSAGSIKKWVLNEDSRSQPSGIKIDKFVITDAPDLNQTDFACLLSDSLYSLTALQIDFDSQAQTLTLSHQDGSPIDPFTMKDVFFGNSQKDANLCDFAGAVNFYHTADFAPVDLSSNQTEVTLVNSNPAYANLTLRLRVQDNGAVNVFWNYQDPTTAAKTPFQVPTDIIDPANSSLANASLSTFVKAEQNQDQPLHLAITNQAGQVVYRLNGMVLSAYLNVISGVAVTKAGSPGLMGLFERISKDLFLPDGVYSLYSRDVPDPVEDGKPPGKNLYGTHPVFMGQASDDSWFGVYTNLAQAQDWWLKNSASGEVNVTSIAVGGLGDLYFFFGQDPNQLVTAYHNLTGKPVLTPQWALGWNQCRWGYHKTSETRAVVEGYRQNDLPLDTMWNDIDYLDRYEDFTEDPFYFADLKTLVEELHANDTHYIPILDIGIAERASGYDAYAKGLEQDVYVKAPNGEPFTGRVWPGDAVYPDFFAENTAQWWKEQLSALHELIPFDGLWEDMNEASNFCNGPCYRQQEAQDPVKFKLPYVPTGRDLEIKSMSLDAQHAGNLTELDTHSLIGTQEVKVTHDWFLENKMRPMIIERSSFAGMGKFGSRWMGDNFAQEEYMGLSVTGVQAHNIMGIPLVGADICGFIGDTNPELCARWHVVGAFYPFSRNHNDRDSMSQEPYQFTEIYQGSTSYLDIMRHAIKTKYSLVRYYYTQLSLLTQTGGAFYKPLFFEFPADAQAFKDQHRNVMLGKALKLSVLSDALNQNQTDFYFPQGDWCDLFREGLAEQSCFTSAGAAQTLDTFAYNFYVHFRAGFIVPFQNTSAFNFSTTLDLQKQPVDFLIHAACDAGVCSASGSYLNDDGLTTELEGNQNVFEVQLATLNNAQVLNFTVLAQASNFENNKVNENDVLGQVQFFNAQKQGLNVNHTVTAMMQDGSQRQMDVATYDADLDRLVAKTEGLQLGDVVSLTFAKQ